MSKQVQSVCGCCGRVDITIGRRDGGYACFACREEGDDQQAAIQGAAVMGKPMPIFGPCQHGTGRPYVAPPPLSLADVDAIRVEKARRLESVCRIHELREAAVARGLGLIDAQQEALRLAAAHR